VLHFGPNASLDFFGLIAQRVWFILFVQGFAFARLHGDLPVHVVLGIRTFLIQNRPWHDVFHLFQELAFAGFLGTEIGGSRGLFHGINFLSLGLQVELRLGSYAEFP
jgi:hypothetical protein